jgi:hypothetical protein
MKIYFANNSALSWRPVDAAVETTEEGAIVLAALAAFFANDAVIMRARVKSHGEMREERFIGTAASAESDAFITEVRKMTT